MYSEVDLLKWNARGLIPGPAESHDSFLRRTESISCYYPEKDLKVGCGQGDSSQPTFASLPVYSSARKAFEIIKELFDAIPDWLEVRVDSKGLLPWEAAATWIEEDHAGLKKPSIQTKPSLPFYFPEEIVAHELVHAMRVGFEEKRFEEILAYRTSKNAFRRYFGPLFSDPKEVKGFIVLTLATWLFYWTECILDREWGGCFLFWLPVLLLGGCLLRLIRAQFLFSRTLKNIDQVISKPGKSLAVALRLRDAEIIQFAQANPQDILAYVQREKTRSLRWHQLFCSYFHS